MHRYVDFGNSALAEFVEAYSTMPDGTRLDAVPFPVDNLARTTFDLNTRAPTSLAELEAEIAGPYLQARSELTRIPVAGEIRTPAVLATNQAWCAYLARNVNSWENHASSLGLIHFYRSITSQEHQTPAHMRIVHAVAVAFDLITSWTLIPDDPLDLADTREGRPAWHRAHPVSVYSDIGLLDSQARLILEHIVPAHHPCHAEIIRIGADYNRHSYYYFAAYACASNIRDAEPGLLAQDYEPYGADQMRGKWNLIDRLDEDSLFSWNWLRGIQYLYAMMEFARLLACYEQITPTSSAAYGNCVEQTGNLFARIDDFSDLGLERTKDGARWVLDDIVSGEVSNLFLLNAMRIRNELADPAERAAFTDTMHAHFGTGDPADAVEIARLWHRYGVFPRTIDHLQRTFADWKAAADTAACEISMPADFFVQFASYTQLQHTDPDDHESREQVYKAARKHDEFVENILHQLAARLSQPPPD